MWQRIAAPDLAACSRILAFVVQGRRHETTGTVSTIGKWLNCARQSGRWERSCRCRADAAAPRLKRSCDSRYGRAMAATSRLNKTQLHAGCPA
jgi:hypothetical protein